MVGTAGSDTGERGDCKDTCSISSHSELSNSEAVPLHVDPNMSTVLDQKNYIEELNRHLKYDND